MPQKLFGGYLSSSRQPPKIFASNALSQISEEKNDENKLSPNMNGDLKKEANTSQNTLVEIDMFNKAKKIYKSPYQHKTSLHINTKPDIQVADISSNSNNLPKSSEIKYMENADIDEKEKLPLSSPKSKKINKNELSDGKIIKLKEPHMIYQNPDEYYRNTEKKGCKMLMPQTKTNISKLKAQNQLKIKFNTGLCKPKKTPKVVLFNVFTDRALLKQVSVNTNEKKIENGLNNSTDDSTNDIPCNWLVGDLVWARLSTYPWWPSMITYDPSSGIFTRIKKKNYREFHVQFFGENARAWVHDKNIIKFEEPLPYKKVLKLVECHTSSPSKPKVGTPSVGRKKKIDTNNTSIEDLNDKSLDETADSSQLQDLITPLTPLNPKSTEGEQDELSSGVQPKLRALWAKGLAIAEKAIGLNRVERRQTLTIDFPASSKGITKPRTPTTYKKRVKENAMSFESHNHNNSSDAANSSLDNSHSLVQHVESSSPDNSVTYATSHADPGPGDNTLPHKDSDARKLTSDSIDEGPESEGSHKRSRKLSSKLLEYKLLPIHKKTHNVRKDEPNQSLEKEKGKSNQDNDGDHAPTPLTEEDNPKGNSGGGGDLPDGSGQQADAKDANGPANFKMSSLSSLVEATNQNLSKPNNININHHTKPTIPISASPKNFGTPKDKKRKDFPLTPRATSSKLKRPVLGSSPNHGSKSDGPKTITPIGTKKKIGNIPMVGEEEPSDLKTPAPETTLAASLIKVEREEIDIKADPEILANLADPLDSATRALKVELGSGSNEPTHSDPSDAREKMADPQDSICEPSTPSSSSTASVSSRNTYARYQLCFTCKTLEPVVPKASQTGEDGMIKCTSKMCTNTYHRKCLGFGSTTPAHNYLCDECASNKHPCFVCKNYEGDPERCMIATCGKYFHKACISRYPLTVLDTNGIICPRHQCASCISDNAKNPRATRGKFYRCILCPCTYHANKDCIAAGSLILSDYNIICSDHNQPENHLNVGWCFICSKGDGNLFCCDSCPAAFHHTCLPGIHIPLEGVWWCPDCESGKRPVYGDIVWIKLTSYRWWPGRVCNPEEVSPSVREKGPRLRDMPGHFPVYFFGSGEFYWINRTRVFLFADGDTSATQESSSSQGKSLNKIFTKALQEAAEEFEKRKSVKQERLLCDQSRVHNNKPRPFKMIKSNKPIGNVQIYHPTPSDIQHVLHACNCDPAEEHPCSDDSVCLNRISFVECHPKVCKAGPRCENQRFVKRIYPLTKPGLTTDNRGWGLMAMVDIKKGEFINEYVGELIDEAECLRRIEISYRNNIDDFYFLTIDKDRIIDAGPKGNLSRFMNHHCQPNMETQKWTVNGDVRVGLFAIRDITKGSELVFNYNFDCLGNEKKKCHCGALNCSGYMGVRPPKMTELTGSNGPKRKYSSANSSSAKARPGPKPKPRDEFTADDDVCDNVTRDPIPAKALDTECFVCSDVGELISCDRPSCTKVYHLTCVGLSNIPQLGKWTCPRHICSACGATEESLGSSVIPCDECPVSFCTKHLGGGNMLKISDPQTPSDPPIVLCSTANQTHKRYLTELIDVKKMTVETYQS